ncbi:aromatic ring-hydroxylating dioxygenase subunit alpha [Novosphingobium sp. MMS21-SN21R]|uniref:aromatic ring-hydroxylating dioxygenase subunit alpha n=1 Tax=Novosphingobium sp. MMS21-SN21R TaxID=2969298 RepID=UPI002885B819|nr:aromatic ring-hydroxylating dioxygenase subunit alpha [Novosphingobium sp. MMS21-SN21R]MDT0510235.1 aromatic ring-hydroxylating dioxygenase subunit alpha [Novosphingobium sp. MMS21-SN21R]
MADRNTPFIFNEWYVAAFAADVGRELLARKLLGKNVVMFRTEQGRAVALDDRCAHRSFPLSEGTLDADTVVCGYHGFRYDADGDCVEVPSMKVCPAAIGVRAYPLVERGPLLWIWLGDPALVDPGAIRDTTFMESDAWVCSTGYLWLAGNYVGLHENLMDLTHLSYVHAKSFGTPEYAQAPYKAWLDEGHYKVTRSVIPTVLPPVWGDPSGLSEVATAARVATSEFLSPAFHQVGTSFYDSAVPEDVRTVCSIRTAHLPTPETHETTHYFIVHGRDFALADPGVTQVMHDRLLIAFREDVEALGRLERVLQETPADQLYEISVASDGPGVAMRRHLLRRALEEHNQTQA